MHTKDAFVDGVSGANYDGERTGQTAQSRRSPGCYPATRLRAQTDSHSPRTQHMGLFSSISGNIYMQNNGASIIYLFKHIHACTYMRVHICTWFSFVHHAECTSCVFFSVRVDTLTDVVQHGQRTHGCNAHGSIRGHIGLK